jgi:hypothetical protein
VIRKKKSGKRNQESEISDQEKVIREQKSEIRDQGRINEERLLKSIFCPWGILI